MRILIAEDDDVARCKLESLLTRWGYEVISVEDGTKAWEVLQFEDSPRLTILDWMMPGLDGSDICRRLRQTSQGAYVYVLLLTSKVSKQDIVAGMEAGADDYLSKPYDAQELKVRVRAGERIIQLQEALREQATHDSLTGVWNHGAIIDILQRELARGEREGTALAAILVDLDKFKHVNDVYGHLAGDAVLQAVAARMSRAEAVRRDGPLRRGRIPHRAAGVPRGGRAATVRTLATLHRRRTGGDLGRRCFDHHQRRGRHDRSRRKDRGGRGTPARRRRPVSGEAGRPQ